MLEIALTTARRYILGKQGLWPGRRWSGIEGAAQALRACEAVQLDPLNVVARSQDLVLQSRVLDYHLGDLETLIYRDRQFFDYGGGLFVYPMEELPYWRTSMLNKGREPRWALVLQEHQAAIAEVRAALRERGPLGNRDFKGNSRVLSYRARKDTGMALYYLWLTGELMTHHRQNFERKYDFLEKVAPRHLQQAASAADSEAYFSRKALSFLGLSRQQAFTNNLAGFLERKVSRAEGQAQLARLVELGQADCLRVEGWKEPVYLLTEDLPFLETLAQGEIPAGWQPLGPSTSEEVTFLAPLEIVSARGRAKKLFGFEYLWEVYKPASKRRWGYYTLPILYGDQLVARLDPKLDRATRTLSIHGFWTEDEATLNDEAFLSALSSGLTHLARFTGADKIDLHPASLRGRINPSPPS